MVNPNGTAAEVRGWVSEKRVNTAAEQRQKDLRAYIVVLVVPSCIKRNNLFHGCSRSISTRSECKLGDELPAL